MSIMVEFLIFVFNMFYFLLFVNIEIVGAIKTEMNSLICENANIHSKAHYELLTVTLTTLFLQVMYKKIGIWSHWDLKYAALL